jgi:hypothetical protein
MVIMAEMTLMKTMTMGMSMMMMDGLTGVQTN